MISRLGELLETTLQRAGLEASSAICQIAERWTEIVGPRVATKAAPIRLVGGELTLSAPDPVWRQELTLLGPEIVQLVNQNLQKSAVRRVKLVTGAVRGPDPARARRRLLVPATPRTPPAPSTDQPGVGPDASDASELDVASALARLARARSERLQADLETRRAARTRGRARGFESHAWTRRRRN